MGPQGEVGWKVAKQKVAKQYIGLPRRAQPRDADTVYTTAGSSAGRNGAQRGMVTVSCCEASQVPAAVSSRNTVNGTWPTMSPWLSQSTSA